MIISIVKRYCICGGPANVGEIIETTPNEHMVEVTAKKKPETNFLTRGVSPARLVAHNLPFDHRIINAAAYYFKMLYASGQGGHIEFWSIEVAEGKKATLKLLAIDEAAKVFNELSKKLYSHTFLFDPERYKRQVEIDRNANADLKEQEKQRIEQAARNVIGPFERMDSTPPLKGWG